MCIYFVYSKIIIKYKLLMNSVHLMALQFKYIATQSHLEYNLFWL